MSPKRSTRGRGSRQLSQGSGRRATLEESRRKGAAIGFVLIGLAATATIIAAVAWPRGGERAAGPPPPVAPVARGRNIEGTTPCPNADGTTRRADHFSHAPPMCIDLAKVYVARFITTEGTIEATLDPTVAPRLTNNFVVLARYHYYDGTALFRTNTHLAIIQGGSPRTQGSRDPGPGYRLKDEGNPQLRTYAAGDVVMASTADPNSAAAQFLLVAASQGPVADAPSAAGTGRFLKLGTTTRGMDVVHRILSLHRGRPGQPAEGHPRRPIVVNRIEIVEQ